MMKSRKGNKLKRKGCNLIIHQITHKIRFVLKPWIFSGIFFGLEFFRSLEREIPEEIQ